VTLARWTSGLQLADIPPAVQQAAKRCLIDTTGVALAGSRTWVAMQAVALSRLTAAEGRARALGDEHPVCAPAAAFVNATAAHALDFDDNAYPAFVHGSAVIMPAALAVAQMQGLSGARLLAAFVAGAECEYALGKALTRQLYDRGWWTTGVLGVVGACAAASHALDLTTDAKTLMAGRSSEAGVIAALLARQGCTGPLDIVEHSRGLAAMFNGGRLEPVTMPGDSWSLLKPGVDIKRVPVCLSSHAAIDALREMLGRGVVAAPDIAEIICDVPPIVIQNLVHDLPVTLQQAQFSMPFAMAYTVLLGDLSLAMLDDAVLGRADLLTWMKRVRMSSSDRWQPQLLESAPEGAWVKVVRHDGSAVEGFCAMPLGSTAQPLSSAQLNDKFMQCSTRALPLPRAECLLDDLLRLEQLPGVRHLLAPEALNVETIEP
jgi:2-methylcitrate dehydratase PrpD